MPRFRFVDRPSGEPEWQALHRAADRGIPDIRQPFLTEVAALRDGLRPTTLEGLITEGGAAAVVGEIPWAAFEAKLTGAWLPALRATQHRAMRALLGQAERDLPVDQVVLEKQEVIGRFNLTNPSSIAVAARQAAEAVREVSDGTKRAIREIVRRGQLGQLTVQQQARRIEALVGLTERQTASVLTFELGLLERGITGTRIDELVARKAIQVLQRRAMTIARHETLKAANLGQQDLWVQAADQGLIDATTAMRRWIRTFDDRTCPVCRPMDGQLRPLDEPFVSPYNGAEAMTPPIHVICRCAVALEVP